MNRFPEKKLHQRMYDTSCMIRRFWKEGWKEGRKEVVIIDLPVGLDIRDEDDDGCFCCSAEFFYEVSAGG